MNATIRNKLIWGFSGVLLLLGAVAGIGIYAVFSLRQSAQDATRIGGRLNATALEIQVHNLEAERRVKSYLREVKQLGADKAREKYLDEADFELSAIESLALKAAKIAPTAEKREKFQKIVNETATYKIAMAAAVTNAENEEAADTAKAYFSAADRLHDYAEDGEAAGREASQTSQEDIDRTSKSSVSMAIGMSLVGMILGITMSYKLSRAILLPVEHLKDVAENVSLGNLEVAVRRYSDDEIGDLADSFSRMVTAVKFFRMEAETVQAEHDSAGGE